mgnify:CR=1 FL=1
MPQPTQHAAPRARLTLALLALLSALACAGYGSTVTVTATFGFVAAGEAVEQLIATAAG